MYQNNISLLHVLSIDLNGKIQFQNVCLQFFTQEGIIWDSLFEEKLKHVFWIVIPFFAYGQYDYSMNIALA